MQKEKSYLQTGSERNNLKKAVLFSIHLWIDSIMIDHN